MRIYLMHYVPQFAAKCDYAKVSYLSVNEKYRSKIIEQNS